MLFKTLSTQYFLWQTDFLVYMALLATDINIIVINDLTTLTALHSFIILNFCLSQHLFASFFHCLLKNLLNIFSILVWHNKHKSNFVVIKLTSKSSIDALTVIPPIKKNEKLCNFGSLVCHNAMHSCFETLHAGKWSFHHFEYISVLTIPSYVLQRRDRPTH